MDGGLFYRVGIIAPGVAYDLSPDVDSIWLEQCEQQPDLLLLQISDPYKVLSHALQEGMKVELELGTAEEHSIVFRGRICRVEGSFPSAGVPTLKLKAYDRSMDMGLRKRNRAWTDMKLSDIVKAIADEYFSSTAVELEGDPQFEGNGIRQQEETDLAFLLRLAEQYGCVMYVKANEEKDTFHFIAEHKVMSTEPEVTLYYGRCGIDQRLLEFNSSADVGERQLPRVLSGLDPRSGQLVEAPAVDPLEVGTTEDSFFDENMAAFRAREPTRADGLEQLLGAAEATQAEVRTQLGKQQRVAAPAFSTEENLSLAAKNQHSTRLKGMRGGGKAQGLKDLMARTAVQLADLGGRFSGTWYLAEVRHVVGREGYQTHFECRR